MKYRQAQWRMLTRNLHTLGYSDIAISLNRSTPLERMALVNKIMSRCGTVDPSLPDTMIASLSLPCVKGRWEIANVKITENSDLFVEDALDQLYNESLKGVLLGRFSFIKEWWMVKARYRPRPNTIEADVKLFLLRKKAKARRKKSNRHPIRRSIVYISTFAVLIVVAIILLGDSKLDEDGEASLLKVLHVAIKMFWSAF